jgi:hypothetical protein
MLTAWPLVIPPLVCLAVRAKREMSLWSLWVIALGLSQLSMTPLLALRTFAGTELMSAYGLLEWAPELANEERLSLMIALLHIASLVAFLAVVAWACRSATSQPSQGGSTPGATHRR